jgi:hypothetical protein
MAVPKAPPVPGLSVQMPASGVSICVAPSVTYGIVG